MTDVVTALVERIRAQGVGGSPEANPFWREQLEPLKALLAGEGLPSARKWRAKIGYNSWRLPEGCASNRDVEGWPQLEAAVRKKNPALLPRQDRMWLEHAAQLVFLNGQGLLDEYVAWLDARGLRSDMNLGRFYWYRRKLQRVLSSLGLERVGPYLEVGAGSGRFALMLAQAGMIDHIVLVDLPEMLLNAALLVREEAPGTPVRYGEAPDFSAPPGVWLLETTDIRKVSLAAVGLAVNINSLMEMDEGVRDFYIAEVYRVLRPGGLFYNVNRRQERMTRRDGTAFDSNPLLYPYRPTDRILEWEVDNCQMACKSGWAFSPASYAISRISQVQ